MKIPDESDWRSEPGCLDVKSAYGSFYGKDLAEAEALFVTNSLRYQEDIMFMPLACFRYYIWAYAHYLLSPSSINDSDGASCFFGLVDCRMQDILKSSHELQAKIKEVLLRLKEDQRTYDADPEIYGDFDTRARPLLDYLNCIK